MKNQLTFKEVLEKYEKHNKNKNCDLVRSNGMGNAEIICRRCGKTFTVKSLTNWLFATKNPDCPYCGKNSKNLSVEVIEYRLKQLDFELVNRDEYKNTHSKILVKDLRCSEHGPFYTTFNKLQQGLRCPTCGNIRSKDCERLSAETVKIRLGEVNDFFSRYELVDIESDYKNYNAATIRVKCTKCGREFKNSYGNLLKGEGCPSCKISHIEVNSVNFLRQKGYEEIIEHFRGFSDLRGKKHPLEIDIVLKNTQIGDIFIELNGEFHYEFSNTIGNIEDTIKNDNKKVNYFLKKNESTFIVIPFWEFKRIYEILTNIENLDKLQDYNITVIKNNKVLQKLKCPKI